MQSQVGASAMLHNIKEDMPYLVEKMPEIPGLVYKSLKAYADGEYHLKQMNEIEKIRNELKASHQNSLVVICGSSLFIAAAIVYSLAESALLLYGAPILSWVLGITGALLVIYGIKK
jgi:ubiquinone biosynthesis protein